MKRPFEKAEALLAEVAPCVALKRDLKRLLDICGRLHVQWDQVVL